MFRYCVECKKFGKIQKLDNTYEYCSCKYGEDLKFRETKPILYDVMNNKVMRFIILLFNKLTSTWFWNDVKWEIIKIIKFPFKLMEWSKIIYNDSEFSSEYLLDLIEFKLKKYKKALEKDTFYMYSDIRAKEIDVVLRNLDKYRNIEKYTGKVEYDYWLEKIPDSDYFSMKDSSTKEQKELINKQYELEEINYNLFFDRLKRKSRRWGL